MQGSPNLNDFVMEEVLRFEQYDKVIAYWGHFGDKDRKAVVIFKTRMLPKDHFPKISQFSVENCNNQYTYFRTTLPTEYNVQVVYPADSKHYSKYSNPKTQLIRQTKQMYKELTLSKIGEQLARNLWIDSIFKGDKEQDRILFRKSDPQFGYILIKDASWIDNKPSTMHVLAIAQNKNVYCLRELKSQHTHFLKEIQQKTRQILKQEFNIDSYREYFHYPPTFYQLHIHFESLQMGGRSTMIERCHELGQVISNLELKDGYYSEGTFTIVKKI